MSVPTKTTVLVIGGGPAGSYASSVLAREGVDVTLLEADVFPRYHIGESMLASMRFFLRFIDLEKDMDAHGFNPKYGATFKITEKREAFTNFAASLGKGGHAWNVIRSEMDNLMFQHAGKQGANIFDGTKVTEIEFEPYDNADFTTKNKLANPGRPIAAKWSRKEGSETSGRIEFDYLIDASGRAGIISTKYLKNRTLNQGLKNVANWGYWKGAARYGVGTEREGSPFFEALSDGAGWCWAIPLHNDTLSIGVVMRQDLYMAKKKENDSPPIMDMYKLCLQNAPQINKLVQNAECVSEIKMASDWSYSASAYAIPHCRLAGDAGCFIDPYFSSGVHLACTSGLSAAMTIQAARNGEVDEFTAAKWHSNKVTEGYTRFLVVVMAVLRQLRRKNTAILADDNEEGFDSAFGLIQPVIQGTADTGERDSGDVAQGVSYAMDKFQQATPEERSALLSKVQNAGDNAQDLEKLTPDELAVLHTIVGRQLKLSKTEKDLENFTNDAIEGYKPRLVRGSLGLDKAVEDAADERAELFNFNRSLVAKDAPTAEQQEAKEHEGMATFVEPARG